MEQIGKTAPPTASELIQLARKTLAEALPADWKTELDRGPRPDDARLRLSPPDGPSATLIVEARTIVDARDVPAVTERMRLADDPDAAGGLVVARYLSPRAREA